MTLSAEALYLQDGYKKEFDATVTKAEKRSIVIDKTLFYPASGGQPSDTGVIVAEDGAEYNVVHVSKSHGAISHEVDKEGLKEGDKVHGRIDWDRRYRLMRYHTAAHLLSEVIYKETGARITGNQLDLDKGRIDFDLKHFDREKLKSYADLTNETIHKKIPVSMYFQDREEAFKDPELFSLKNALPPEVKDLRIVNIEGFDKKACGGTHVRNIGEIGRIEIIGAENKGKNNRRVYFRLAE
jgi:misacylated tRNA(Ala) deacylase